MIKKVKRSLSPFIISLTLHGLLLAFLAVFPPTKSFIFFKIHKKTQAPITDVKEKLLEEISIVKIPKKNTNDNLIEMLSEEIASISEEALFLPHIDLTSQLNEKINLDIEIDHSSSFAMAELENVRQEYESYLSPLKGLISEDLLSDEEPKSLAFEPYAKPAQTPQNEELNLAQIDDMDLASFVKPMPEMLDTELYTYKDQSNDEFFKMELKLKEHKLFEEKPQEFLFVIDMSHKETRKNLGLYKDAIMKSMPLLKPQDRVNIVMIGKQLERFFPESKNYNRQVSEFINDLFAKNIKIEGKPRDIIRHLGSIFDKSEENDIHTHCIFFSQEPQKEAENYLKLSRYAHSKLSFYPVIFSEVNSQPKTLKNLVENLGGRLLVPPTKASFGRKFSNLILDIKKTRLRNVSIKVESDEGPVDITLSEKTKQLTLKKPLKIFGKLKGTKNIKLQVVGSHGDDLYQMKKNLSIHEAKKGSTLIKRELEDN